MRQAVGFDEARGDTISVVNSAFQPVAAIDGAGAARRSRRTRSIWSIARQVLGAGARARARVVRAAPDDASADAAAAGRLRAGGGRVRGGQMQPMFGGGGRVIGLPMGYDDRMAAARSVAGQDPRQVAQVVRNWVAEDNG